ncbi:hypothetical protein BDR05DRAFT_953486 [Suillus weaverae]|nr:hypothetical protein BDR05DRAFT_953486 [Suillus weaverae]
MADTQSSLAASPQTTRQSSPLSWPPSREGSPVSEGTKLTTSPLHISLLASVKSAGALTEEAVGEKNIPVENNPRPLSVLMGDKAEYWVNGSGNLLCLKFPARLDFHGKYSHLGPYFSLPDSGLDLTTLKRARGHFELHFLSPNDEESAQYPQEALDMSRRVLETLSALTTEVEDVRNASHNTDVMQAVPQSERPVVSAFFLACSANEQDNFVLLVQSEPLFKDLPNDNQGAVPCVSRSDIGRSKVLLSPSKAKKLAQNKEEKSSSSNNGGSTASEVVHIRDLYDPDSRYSGLGSLRNTKVECPDVRDSQGTLIHPRDYRTKLQQACFVEVEVYLKLWRIPPKTKINQMMSDREKFAAAVHSVLEACRFGPKGKVKGIRRARRAISQEENQCCRLAAFLHKNIFNTMQD